MPQPLISICIPTYNRCKYLYKTLSELTSEQIFRETDDVQIVISDNCSTDYTEIVCNDFVRKFPSKIKYVRQKETIFAPYNIYGVLDYADGRYLKLQNDNIYFAEGALAKLAEIIKEQNADVIFCINKDNNEENKLKRYENVNDVVDEISYMTTWMCAHCYKAETYRSLEYIDKYMKEWVSSVDILFRMVEKKSVFVCWYENVFCSQTVERKGGQYNVAEVFGKNYLSLLKEYVSKKQLSKAVFEKEKKLILKFINNYYFDLKNRYTFQKTGYFCNLYKDYRNSPYFYINYISYVFKVVLRVLFDVEKSDTHRKFRVFGFIKFKIKRKGHKKSDWDLKNGHNNTWPVKPCPVDRIIIGKATYGPIDAQFSSIGNEKLIIGNFCSVAEGVKFIAASEHPYKGLSTFPFKVYYLGYDFEAQSKGDIVVKDDVWIATNAIILSGVTIGQGAIVAAGAVVTKDVPPYAVVGGNPAKVIKYRFEPEIIEKLLKFDFSKLTDEKIRELNIKLYKEITPDNVDKLLEEFQS